MSIVNDYIDLCVCRFIAVNERFNMDALLNTTPISVNIRLT